MIMYVYSFFMFMMFFFSFIISMWLFMIKMDILFEWLVFSVNSMMLELYVLVDWISCLFISFILLISSMVIIYSMDYMKMDRTMVRFFYLVLLFVVSMMLMILSPSMVSIMFGWDMLGLVSYCLVIYYSSYYSFYSGMVTVLTNRIGDVGLLMAIAMMMVNGSWNMCFISGDFLLVSMIILASITKSAQVPFSFWLPLAMAAPTPVSSLVHSSTLVTAGVYLIIRFNDFLVIGGGNFILLFISVFTMLMAGVLASFEYDLKKVIALSTLSQLGLMMTILSLGAVNLGFFHLLTHAVFKSLLFLCAGCMIHSLKDTQDIRCYGGLNEISPFIFMNLYVSMLGLVGFPFLSGFYSKDLILEFVYVKNISLFMLFFILMSVSFTVLYSVRLCYYIYFSNLKLNSSVDGHQSLNMGLSMLVLLLFSIIVGSCLSWGFFFDSGVVIFSWCLKVLTFLMIVFGGMMWWLSPSMYSVYWLKDLLEISSSMVKIKELNSLLGSLSCHLSLKLNMVNSKWNEFFQVKMLWWIVSGSLEVFYMEGKIPVILGHGVLMSSMLFLLVFTL